MIGDVGNGAEDWWSACCSARAAGATGAGGFTFSPPPGWI